MQCNIDRNLVSETKSCNVALLDSKMPANAQSVLGQNRTRRGELAYFVIN